MLGWNYGKVSMKHFYSNGIYFSIDLEIRRIWSNDDKIAMWQDVIRQW